MAQQSAIAMHYELSAASYAEVGVEPSQAKTSRHFDDVE